MNTFKFNKFGFQAPIIKPVSLINDQETILTAINNLVEESSINEPLSNNEIQTTKKTKEKKTMKTLSTTSVTKVKKSKKQRAHYRKGHYRRMATGKTVWISGKIVHEEEYYKLRTESPTNFYNRMNSTSIKIRTLFSYTGGKSLFYKQTQFLWNEMIEQKRVERLLIPFLGGGSDFLSIAVKAIESGVKTAIVNDLNPIIANFYGHLKHNRQALKEEITLIGDQCFADSDEKKLYLEILADEANLLEIQGNYSSLRLASLFFVLQNNSHKGLYEFDGTKSRYSMGLHKDEEDQRNLIESYMTKIDFYGYFIDQFEDFIIENRSYDDLIEEYDDVHTLIVADPLYVEEKHDETDETALRPCSIDYGFADFDHDRCFEVFSSLRSQLIYHNSYNTILINKFKQCELKDFMIVDKKSISRDENNKHKKSVELIFYTDKRTFVPNEGLIDLTAVVVANAINSTDYRPLVIAA